MNKHPDKIALLVATEKGYRALTAVLERHRDVLGLVSTFNEPLVKVSFHEQIRQKALENDVPFIPWKELKQFQVTDLEANQVSAILAIGWRFLLPQAWNHGLKHGVFVIHDSLLPKYRGFAPTPTAIICGESEIGISLIRAAAAMDEGAVLLQRQLSLHDDWYIQDVITHLCDLYVDATLEFAQRIQEEQLDGVPQDSSDATYSIWRGVEDCQINWNDSATSIYNLIRAVSTPYPGAFTFLEDKKVIVHRAAVLEHDFTFAIRQPGKIFELDEAGRPTVICGKGLMKILEADCEGQNLLPVKKLRQRFGR